MVTCTSVLSVATVYIAGVPAWDSPTEHYIYGRPALKTGQSPHSTHVKMTNQVEKEVPVSVTGPPAMANERVWRAHEAAEIEKSMKFTAVVRKYWKAVAWSMCLSTALIMEGYDVGIVSRAEKPSLPLMSDQRILGKRRIPRSVW